MLNKHHIIIFHIYEHNKLWTACSNCKMERHTEWLEIHSFTLVEYISRVITAIILVSAPSVTVSNMSTVEGAGHYRTRRLMHGNNNVA